MSFSAWFLRTTFLRSDNKRDAGLVIPESITVLKDERYGGFKENTLDVYYPKGTEGKLPVIVSIHGGGYVYGTTKTYQFYGADLAGRGFVFVNFNYRLAPENKFPSPLEDTNQVMRWLIQNAERCHADLDHVFMIGDSAGGQLLSQYATMVTNPEYAKIMGIIPPEGFNLRAIGLNCGMYNINAQTKNTHGLKGVMRDYFGKDFQKHGEKLNVLRYITSDYPPTYLISAPGDFLVENQQPMCDLINERGGHAVYKCYGDKNVGHVFFCNIRSEIAKEANDDECAFFRQYL